MNDPSHRWRFQVHLSTAIWLSLAAGGLLWGNMVKTWASYRGIWAGGSGAPLRENRQTLSDYHLATEKLKCFKVLHYDAGWPFPIHNSERLDLGHYDESGNFITEKEALERTTTLEFDTRAARIDTAIALVILLAIWLASEWWIRRAARIADPVV